MKHEHPAEREAREGTRLPDWRLLLAVAAAACGASYWLPWGFAQ